MASKYLWLFDNGHGGIIDGEYQTQGKRSPRWSDGSILYEGEFNRAIVKRLIKLCEQNGIDCRNIVPEEEDIARDERARRANEIYQTDRRCIYLSIHANAGGGVGWEVFTSRGETRSDKIATVFYETIDKEFPETRMRPDFLDGDPDKEARFDVLVNTRMPAVLTENFFMDTESDCKTYLMTEEGRDRIAKAHFDAILTIENMVV